MYAPNPRPRRIHRAGNVSFGTASNVVTATEDGAMEGSSQSASPPHVPEESTAVGLPVEAVATVTAVEVEELPAGAGPSAGDFQEGLAEAENAPPLVEVVDVRTSDSSDDEQFGFPQLLSPPTASNTHRTQPVALRTRSLQPQVTWRQIIAAATPPSRGRGGRGGRGRGGRGSSTRAARSSAA